MNVAAGTGTATLGWDAVVAVSVVCLSISGFYSGSETGYMSVSAPRLRRSFAGDSPRARKLLDQLRSIEEPILTCLIGTNLFNVAFSAVMTMALTARFGSYGEWLAVLVVSTLVILFGEILPKVLYREYPEQLTLASVPAVSASMVALTPLRWLLRWYRRAWTRVLPNTAHEGSGLDRRSLAALLLTNTMPTGDDRRFSTILNRFLKLAHRSLVGIMQPMEQLVTVGPETTVSECLAVASRSGFSRMPITREDGRHLQAYVLVRDLLFLPREAHDGPVPRRFWRPLLLVDARLTPYELFEELRGQERQLATVTDPAGNPLGVITLEDLIETVMGSIYDEFDAAAAAQPA